MSHKRVRKGENRSPLLFAIYVNDIEECSLSERCTQLNINDRLLDKHMRLFVLMYADRTVIMGESEEGINAVLGVLENYCNHWKL